jgi:tetraacyldisaccharide 4'-kinase
VRALLPLSALYGAVASAKNALYDHGVIRPQRLSWPVISVGNLTAGGSGKTPFVIALAALLREHGLECDVLSRGYGRRTTGVLRVDPTGDADEFGDEPLLIARSVPVYLGARRYEAGLLAEKSPSRRIHLLDDGFQHRKLARDIDIVLVSPADLRDHLLPAGRLREPVRALLRATFLASEHALDLPSWLHGKPVIRYTRQLNVPAISGPVIAFCGIARPQRFFDDLRHQGITLAETISFPDHHRFRDADLARLSALQKKSNATLLTTEKDWLRLGPQQIAKLQPALPVPLRTTFDDPAAVFTCISALLS